VDNNYCEHEKNWTAIHYGVFRGTTIQYFCGGAAERLKVSHKLPGTSAATSVCNLRNASLNRPS